MGKDQKLGERTDLQTGLCHVPSSSEKHRRLHTSYSLCVDWSWRQYADVVVLVCVAGEPGWLSQTDRLARIKGALFWRSSVQWPGRKCWTCSALLYKPYFLQGIHYFRGVNFIQICFVFGFFCPVLNDSPYRMKNVNAHCGFRVGLEKRTFLTTLGGTDCFRHAPHVTRPQTKKAKTYPVPHTVQRLGRVRFIKTCETIRKTFLSRLRFDFLKNFTKKTRG